MTEAPTADVQSTPYEENADAKAEQQDVEPPSTPSKSVAAESLDETAPESVEEAASSRQHSTTSTPTHPTSIEVRKKSVDSGYQGDLDVEPKEEPSDMAVQEDEQSTAAPSEKEPQEPVRAVEKSNSKVRGMVAMLEKKALHECVPPPSADDRSSASSTLTPSQPDPEQTLDAGEEEDAAEEKKAAPRRRKHFVLEWRTTKEVKESFSSQEAGTHHSKEQPSSDKSRSTDGSSGRSSSSIRDTAAKIKAALRKPRTMKKSITEEELMGSETFKVATAKIARSLEAPSSVSKVSQEESMERGKFNDVAARLALSFRPKTSPAPRDDTDEEPVEEPVEDQEKPDDQEEQAKEEEFTAEEEEKSKNEEQSKEKDGKGEEEEDVDGIIVIEEGLPPDTTQTVATVSDGGDNPFCTTDDVTSTATDLYDQVQSTVVGTLTDVCFENSIERTISMDAERQRAEPDTPGIKVFQVEKLVQAEEEEESQVSKTVSPPSSPARSTKSSPVRLETAVEVNLNENTLQRYKSEEEEDEHLGGIEPEDDQDEEIKGTEEEKDMSHDPVVEGRGMSTIETVNSETGSITMLSEEDPRAMEPAPVGTEKDEETCIADEVEKITEREAIDIDAKIADSAESYDPDALKETVEQTLPRSRSLPVPGATRGVPLHRRLSLGKMKRSTSSEGADDAASVGSTKSAASKQSATSKKSTSSKRSTSSRRSLIMRKKKAAATEIPTEVETTDPEPEPAEKGDDASEVAEDVQYEPLADDNSVEVSVKRDSESVKDSNDDDEPAKDCRKCIQNLRRLSTKDGSFLQLDFAEDSGMKVVMEKTEDRTGPADCDVSVITENSVEISLARGDKYAPPHEPGMVVLPESKELGEAGMDDSKNKKGRTPLRSAAKGFKNLFSKKKGGRPPLPRPRNVQKSTDAEGLSFAPADAPGTVNGDAADSNCNEKSYFTAEGKGAKEEKMDVTGYSPVPVSPKPVKSEGNQPDTEGETANHTAVTSKHNRKTSHGRVSRLFGRRDRREKQNKSKKSVKSDGAGRSAGRFASPRRSRSLEPQQKVMETAASRRWQRKKSVEKPEEEETEEKDERQIRSVMSADNALEMKQDEPDEEDVVTPTVSSDAEGKDNSKMTTEVAAVEATQVDRDETIAVTEKSSPEPSSVLKTSAVIAAGTALAGAATVSDFAEEKKEDAMDDLEGPAERELTYPVKSSSCDASETANQMTKESPLAFQDGNPTSVAEDTAADLELALKQKDDVESKDPQCSGDMEDLQKSAALVNGLTAEVTREMSLFDLFTQGLFCCSGPTTDA